MNKNRRQQLKTWKEKAEQWAKHGEEIKSELESICLEEEECFDCMPESLKGSENGMNSEEAIEKMNEAIELIDEAITCVGASTECVDEIL